LAVLQTIVVLAKDEEPLVINLSVEDKDESRNDTDGGRHPLDARLSAIAAQLNCTTLELRHRGMNKSISN